MSSRLFLSPRRRLRCHAVRVALSTSLLLATVAGAQPSSNGATNVLGATQPPAGTLASSAHAASQQFVDDARSQALTVQQVEQLAEQGEAAYRAGRDQEAFVAYGRIVAAVPDRVQAWLRIGNLWQRNGEPWRAVEAYRRAVAAPVPAAPTQVGVAARERIEAALQARAKAGLNLAALGADQARDALASVDRTRLPADLHPLADSLERRLQGLDDTVREPVRPVLR